MIFKSRADKITSALLVVYLITLVWILVLKMGVRFSYMEKRSVNTTPFREYFASNGKVDVAEIILNVLIFVPLGIYAGVLFRGKKFSSLLLFFFLVSFAIEATQYILRIGAFDITDLITNVIGGVIGLLIFGAIQKLFNNGVRSQNFINVISGIGTVIMISLLLLLKLNMLPVRYQ